jgi:ABC-type Fe3+/spermidine/putrescine transport system ATPase subunit
LYGSVRAVESVSFALRRGELLALLGPSGCGKTTVLRLIAGLERLDNGAIHLGERLVSGPGVFVPANRRRVGLVFQDYALFPHMTVEKNIAYGLAGRADRRQRVAEMLALVGLDGLGGRYPHALSGGQQQRVALARALAPQPDIVLLDEPFSNLDMALRRQVREDVQRILRALGVSAILVTHDQAEAMALADRIVVMNNGRVMQIGAPLEVYRRPANTFVASFIGSPPMNLLAGTVDLRRGEWRLGGQGPAIDLRPLFERLNGRLADGQTITLGIRPESLMPQAEPSPGAIPAQVYAVQPLGGEVLIGVRVAGKPVSVRLFRDEPPHLPAEIWLALDLSASYAYDADGNLLQ